MARRKKSEQEQQRAPIYSENGERVVEIEISKLITFEHHPFKVKDDEDMKLLLDSIQKSGIMNPLIVTPKEDGMYRIISGHRRKHCAEQLGFETVPAIIRFMQEEDSIISMIDSNLQRSRISHSEKAFAYKMKNEALKKKAKRIRRTVDGALENIRGKRAVEVLGKKTGDSPRQVTRYIRLTHLIPELLEKLDMDQLGFNPAVDIAFLSEEEQRWVLDVMELTQSSPTLSQTHRIKEMSRDDEMTYEDVRAVFEEEKQGNPALITFTAEQLHRFFQKDIQWKK